MAKAKGAEAKPTGRPAVYGDALALAICERLADGESLKAICEDENMPARTTVYKWIVEDTDGFADKYARAREAQQDTAVDDLADVAQATLEGKRDPQAARVYADIIKWRAAQLHPKKYGNKTTVENTGPDGGPLVQHNVNMTVDEFAGIARKVADEV
jgi:hypothetical protein